MDPLKVFPILNASLNGLSGVLLLAAYIMIRQKRITAHKRLMLTACGTSVLFLICYLTHHWIRQGVVTRFSGTGGWRTFYLTMLTSHTILAVTIVPLAILSVMYGLRNRIPQHRRIAKWTFPLWMYVSVTGVLVYFFLYQWFPAA